MRKVASLVIAVVASFALAGSASALLTASIQGSNAPGTNTYSIVLSWDTVDDVSGVVVSVNTDGSYTGVFTETVTPPFGTALPGPGPIAVGSGVRGSWGAVNGPGPIVGQTLTVGTIEITVGAGDFVNPFYGSLDGFVTFTSFSTILPLAGNITGITIIPEPTTASLLGLGIVGLVLAGRKSRRA